MEGIDMIRGNLWRRKENNEPAYVCYGSANWQFYLNKLEYYPDWSRQETNGAPMTIFHITIRFKNADIARESKHKAQMIVMQDSFPIQETDITDPISCYHCMKIFWRKK